MDRRAFLASSIALIAAPLAAKAQQSGKLPKVGLLSGRSEMFVSETLPAWLGELGYVEGKTVAYERRSSGMDDIALPHLAADLIRVKVDVIVAAGLGATEAARQATATVPIVMVADGDPVKAGLIQSLGRPGGNVTGVMLLFRDLHAKRLELLHEIVPRLTRAAVLLNPVNPTQHDEVTAITAIATDRGVRVRRLEVREPADFELRFQTAALERLEGLIVLGDRLLYAYGGKITALAMKYRLPAVYPSRRFIDMGATGFISLEADRVDAGRLLADYVDRVLKGAKAADLPVQQPTKFELVINLKTAKALGLTIPPSLLLRADQVIE